MSVNIHGKTYITVAERLQLAKDNIQEVFTEVMSYEPVIIVRATVTLKDGRKATGMSGANPSKSIEKSAPVEVAETSAIGRCLGFLNYGAVEGIATADEIVKAEQPKEQVQVSADEFEQTGKCPTHGVQMKKKISSTGGEYWSHSKQEDGELYYCNGKDYKLFKPR